MSYVFYNYTGMRVILVNIPKYCIKSSDAKMLLSEIIDSKIILLIVRNKSYWKKNLKPKNIRYCSLKT